MKQFKQFIYSVILFSITAVLVSAAYYISTNFFETNSYLVAPKLTFSGTYILLIPFSLIFASYFALKKALATVVSIIVMIMTFTLSILSSPYGILTIGILPYFLVNIMISIVYKGVFEKTVNNRKKVLIIFLPIILALTIIAWGFFLKKDLNGTHNCSVFMKYYSSSYVECIKPTGENNALADLDYKECFEPYVSNSYSSNYIYNTDPYSCVIEVFKKLQSLGKLSKNYCDGNILPQKSEALIFDHYCYYPLASVEGDENICNKIQYGYYKTNCLINLAEQKNDPNICNIIKDEYSRNYCINKAKTASI